MDAALLIGLGQDGAAARAAAEAVDAAVFDDGGEVVRGPLFHSFRQRQPHLRRLACQLEPLVRSPQQQPLVGRRVRPEAVSS